ncbi:hypothetical protein Taro_028007 [Colocasia esculenta]|uniref:DYW domain-containing protein n=1 Tax=Colocasia esculenta TaxID=4460 RepID=A0A843VQH3_COLES|nr:hypothetical protein [Colocasia esculenta]
MKRQGVKKEPGLSWIEVGAVVHSFVSGDKSHPQSQKIYAKLEAMVLKIKEAYSVSVDTWKFNGNKELEIEVNFHCKRLAVALGMIALPESSPIRVMKNLRVCLGCHTLIKMFSESERRNIVLRDSIRFHRFSGGSCSCGDYWRNQVEVRQTTSHLLSI